MRPPSFLAERAPTAYRPRESPPVARRPSPVARRPSLHRTQKQNRAAALAPALSHPSHFHAPEEDLRHHPRHPLRRRVDPIEQELEIPVRLPAEGDLGPEEVDLSLPVARLDHRRAALEIVLSPRPAALERRR